MAEKVKIGVIGAGKMGSLHLEKFLQIPYVEVVGFFETNQERAKLVQEKYKVKSFASVEDVLFESDAVSIASPTVTHYSICRRALESGTHVLVEKPMCESPQEALELESLALRVGRVLQVGFLERFRLLSLTKALHFGPIRFIEAHRLSPSLARESTIDVVSDLMIHDLDLALSLIDEEPIHISGIGIPVITPHVDVANVRLEFPSGAVVNLSASRVSATPQRKFRVFSMLRYASLDFINNTVESYSRSRENAIEKHPIVEEKVDALYEQCLSFVNSILRGKPAIVSAQDGFRALKYIDIIRNKIEERAIWKVPASHHPKHELRDN